MVESATAAAAASGWPVGGHALAHLGHGGGGGRDADADEQQDEEEDRQDQVHGRAADHDDDLLRRAQAVEHAVLVAGPDLLPRCGPGLLDQHLETTRGAAPGGPFRGSLRRREHADHPDVAAERDRLDAVLGLAAPCADQRVGPKPTMYWVTLHAERLGRHQVPDLVQPDRQPDAQRRRGAPRARTAWSPSVHPRRDPRPGASARAQPSRRLDVLAQREVVPDHRGRCAAERPRSIVSTMSRKPQPPDAEGRRRTPRSPR